MRFTQDSTSAANLIRAYRAGELTINDAVFRDPVIVSASAIAPGPEIGGVEALRAAHAVPVLALEPELVLLGTGARQQFPDPEFGAQFLRAGGVNGLVDGGRVQRRAPVPTGQTAPSAR